MYIIEIVWESKKAGIAFNIILGFAKGTVMKEEKDSGYCRLLSGLSWRFPCWEVRQPLWRGRTPGGGGRLSGFGRMHGFKS